MKTGNVLNAPIVNLQVPSLIMSQPTLISLVTKMMADRDGKMDWCRGEARISKWKPVTLAVLFTRQKDK